MTLFELAAAERYLKSRIRDFIESVRAGGVGGFAGGNLVPTTPDKVKIDWKERFAKLLARRGEDEDGNLTELHEDDDNIQWVTLKGGKRVPIIKNRVSGSLERPNIKMRKKIVTFKRKDGSTGTRAIYNEKDRQVKSTYKFARTAKLASQITKVEAKLRSEVKSSGTTQERAVATALITMALTGARPGNKGNATAGRPTFGVTTLQARHVTVDGDKVTLRFKGKRGVFNRYEVTDKELAQSYKMFLSKTAEPDDEVFRFAPHSKGLLLDQHLRDRMKKFGGHFLPKDLRTATGCRVAAEVMEQMLARKTAVRIPPSIDAQRKLAKKIAKKLAKKVAAQLNNTPAVCLSAYIDPILLESMFRRMGFNRLYKTNESISRAEYLYYEPEHKRFSCLRALFGDDVVDDMVSRYLDSEEDDDVSDDETDTSMLADELFGEKEQDFSERVLSFRYATMDELRNGPKA